MNNTLLLGTNEKEAGAEAEVFRNFMVAKRQLIFLYDSSSLHLRAETKRHYIKQQLTLLQRKLYHS